MLCSMCAHKLLGGTSCERRHGVDDLGAFPVKEGPPACSFGTQEHKHRDSQNNGVGPESESKSETNVEQ